MKSLFVILFIGVSTLSIAQAQNINPVLWSYTVEKDAEGDTITIRLDASIDPDWYLYAEKEDKDGLSVGLYVKTEVTENCVATGFPEFSETKQYRSSGLEKTYAVMQNFGSIRRRFIKTNASGWVEISVEYMAVSEDIQNQEGMVVVRSERFKVEL